MSTKATRELVRVFKMRAVDSGDGGAVRLAVSVESELDAIEKAAKAINDWQTHPLGPGMKEASQAAEKALDLFQSIASEAK